jgi:hypothetical protein
LLNVLIKNPADTAREGQSNGPLPSDVCGIPVHSREIQHVLSCGDQITVTGATYLERLRDMRTGICSYFRHKTGRE